MKVSNRNDNVELSQTARSKKGDKAGAVKSKDKSETAGADSVGDTANVNISSEAKALATANKIAKTENIDQPKIDKIKAMIGSGTYKPDFGKVADKMINEDILQELA